ncbi:glycosyltransferase family 4 protein [Rothia kristinae]
MRLLVDARYVRPVHDGISRYTAGLLHALDRLIRAGRAPGLRVAMLISDPAQRKRLPDLPTVRGFSPTGPLEPLSALRINRVRPDAVFSPMQTIGTWGRDYAQILTLHDLIYYAHPQPPGFLPAPVRLGWRLFHRSYAPQRWLLDRADAVVTVSRTTAGLMHEHRLTRRPVTVVPNAAPDGVLLDPLEARTRARGRGTDLLYMGSAMPYKGVESLIAGMERLPGYRLHLLSRYPEARRRELAALSRHPERVVFHGGIAEREYRELLRTARALVSASRAEGFGLPVVEAQAQGVPVVLSDIPIFREVAPHGLHVDFVDPQAFPAAVRRLEDPRVRAEIAARGAADAARYSWEASARTLVELAERVSRARRAGGSGSPVRR